jgi:hypothetical protein
LNVVKNLLFKTCPLQVDQSSLNTVAFLCFVVLIDFTMNDNTVLSVSCSENSPMISTLVTPSRLAETFLTVWLNR